MFAHASRFVLLASLTGLLLISLPAVASTPFFINEIFVNPPGDDEGFEYIELRGTPNDVLPKGYYLVAVEGDTSGGNNPGTLDHVFTLSGMSIGSNGYLVLRQFGSTYPTNAMAAVETATSGDLDGNWGASWSNRTDNLENGSTSFLLIFSLTPPVPGTDLDTNNDGTFDNGTATSWIVFDSVANLDGGGSDVAYGSIAFSNDGDGTSAGTIFSLASFGGGFTPDHLGRRNTSGFDSTGFTAMDWTAADVEAVPVRGGTTDWRYDTVDSQVYPADAAGAELNHLGSQNATLVPVELMTFSVE